MSYQEITTVGWDIGGANLKAAAFSASGELIKVGQWSCPLWLGLSHLENAIQVAKTLWQFSNKPCHHIITMSGELVDLFASRMEGVSRILATLDEAFSGQAIHIYAGGRQFIALNQIKAEWMPMIASANWQAMGEWVASVQRHAILVDIGSTTTDLLLIEDYALKNLGTNDHQRLGCDELVYTGVTRTPVMAITQKAPVRGIWVNLMAEYFATMADIYCITDEINPQLDLSMTADGGEKGFSASMLRLARMTGLDRADLDDSSGIKLAEYVRYRQIGLIADALCRQLSRTSQRTPLIGAGIGRFLVPELARIFGLPYQDIHQIMPLPHLPDTTPSPADALPAFAVAYLWHHQSWSQPAC